MTTTPASPFSPDVLGVSGSISAAAFAGALLHARREDYGPIELSPLIGVERPVDKWRERGAAILSPVETIEVEHMLVALGRLDAALGTALRRAGISPKLGGDTVLLPWARRVPVLGWAERQTFPGASVTCAIGPDEQVARDFPSGVTIDERRVFTRPVAHCAYGPDGTLAYVLQDGTVMVGDTAFDANATQCSVAGGRVATLGRDGVTVWQDGGPVAGPFESRGGALAACDLAVDGETVLAPSEGGAALWHLDGTFEAFDAGAPGLGCTLSPSGVHAAVTLDGSRLVAWEWRADDWAEVLRADDVSACEFTPEGDLLLTYGSQGVQAYDVVTYEKLGAPSGASGEQQDFAAGPGGLAAVAGPEGTVVYEPITATVTLPAVSPDSVDGTDLLGVANDAAALADVIAAKATAPPLSIGLFADWGAGKSFLIRQVQERVRLLSRRARQDPEHAAHCAHVRNVEFNAWHFADANLWASLASHILDELAEPAPDSGVRKEVAAAQLARLEQRLADRSSVSERLERARQQTERAVARRNLLFWTWGLATGNDGQKTLESLRGFGTRLRLVAPMAVLAALVIGVLIAVLGLDRAVALGGAALTLLASLGAGANRLGKLLERAGPATPVTAVKGAAADARAARASEAELRQELADLASGRRLARFAAERDAAGDYRSQLGLVSRIHEDFARMSDILAQQGSGTDVGELPQIDRIVLYIDDLDRCQPKRVVEVLEAVHLILALPLFVVVLAVDPRWLLQSLKLHYRELLDTRGVLDPEWESTPLNYLEKIIQIPFALRPMGEGGTTALVASLLPVSEPAPSAEATTTAAPAPTATTEPEPGDLPALTPRPAPTRPPATSFNPRTLTLTAAERDFAADVARQLRTPRAVKKLTNLYRLVRARLDDESGELDDFLRTDYRAVLVILTVLIAWPDRATDFLLGRSPGPDTPLDRFLARYDITATDEPVRRWALELSRYSFETGQEVYAKRA